MPVRWARALLFLACVGAAIAFAVVASRWLAPRPRAEEIFARLRQRDFAGAAATVAQFLEAEPSSPTARILFAFSVESRPHAFSAPGELLAPRGRIFGDDVPVALTSVHGDTVRAVKLEIEGGGTTVHDAGSDGRASLAAGLRAPPAAAGRACIIAGVDDRQGTNAAASGPLFAFEAVNPEIHAALDARLRVVKRIAELDTSAESYLRAMCFAREGCFGNALVELDTLLAEFPANGALRAARSDCAARAAAFPPLTRP